MTLEPCYRASCMQIIEALQDKCNALKAERDAAIERADELGADKGTYFRLYEQACIYMTEKDAYGNHYRTLFNNADTANNRLIDERDALKAELGDLPEAQAEMLAQIKADEELMQEVLSTLEAGDLLCELKAANTLRKRLESK